MKIAVGSAFRNSAARLPHYVAQLTRLRAALVAKGHTLQQIAVWGDCTDHTAHALWASGQRFGLNLVRVERSHHGPVFQSTEAPERMKALQYVGNGILEAVQPDVDVLVYVESDLLWRPGPMVALIEQLDAGVTDVVAPLVFAGETFYDIFAYRAQGERFSPFPPYHRGFAEGADRLEVDSAGSCLVMRGDVARTCRIGESEGLVSFCADVRAHGYHLWVDRRIRIDHPV